MSHNIIVEGGSSVRLPTAGKYCDRDIVITAEGGSKVDCNAVEHFTAYDIEDLMLWHSIAWYASITTAVEDVKNGTIGANVLEDSAEATVGVYEDNSIPCIVLLKDCTISAPITLTDIYVNLNGCVLTSTDSVAVEVSGKATIDGRAKESKIIASRTAVNVTGGDCTIIGGAYETMPSGTGTSGYPDGVFVVADGAEFKLSHASVTSTDDNGGTICGIWAKGNSIINAYDCSFEITSKRGFNVCGMYGDGTGEATFTSCNIVAEADHTANEAGTNYATMSRAIDYTGTLYLYNCYVYGTHSGVTAKGDITVVGGTYEGYSHGGFYISCGIKGVNKTACIYDATVKECTLHEGYIDDGVAGTNLAGMYIGGASNTTIYIDNCNLFATAQVIVLRGSSGERYNTLYISGTHINHNYSRTGIRIDSSTHAVYIGADCNFDSQNTDRSSVCTKTDEIYRLSNEDSINLQEKTIVENGEYTADDGYDGLSKVIVDVPVPDGYIQPSGTKDITANGTHDITQYASINVNVPTGGGGGELPEGYKRCDYILFSGSQWVDTGVIGTQDTQINTSFTWENSTQRQLFGCASSDNTAAITAYMNGSWRFGAKSASKSIGVKNPMLPYAALVNKTTISVTGAATSISGVANFQTVGTLLLGGARVADGTYPSVGIYARVFHFSLWQGDELVRKLVPVTDGNGAYRFYDMVSKTFFDSVTSTPLYGGNL